MLKLVLMTGFIIGGIPLAQSSDQVGTLTQIQGKVELFTHPSKTLPTHSPNTGKRALFEGQYYWVEIAKAGDRVEKGNILRTALDGKARVIFQNGDQYNVGPGTAYKVNWDKDSAQANAQVGLMYGKFRGVVSKDGPRTRLKIRTPSATMGVRGTDFFIAEGGKEGGTEVTILRGAVELKPATAPKNAKPIEVKQGFSAVVPPPPPQAKTADVAVGGREKKKVKVANAPPLPQIELREVTKEDLAGIKSSTKVEALKKEDLSSASSRDIASQVDQLEAKAVETTLQDIKTHDPKLYAQISVDKKLTADQANELGVEQMAKTAPSAPSKRKPYKSEIEDLENGAYEKYFKEIN